MDLHKLNKHCTAKLSLHLWKNIRIQQIIPVLYGSNQLSTTVYTKTNNWEIMKFGIINEIVHHVMFTFWQADDVYPGRIDPLIAIIHILLSSFGGGVVWQTDDIIRITTLFVRYCCYDFSFISIIYASRTKHKWEVI